MARDIVLGILKIASEAGALAFTLGGYFIQVGRGTLNGATPSVFTATTAMTELLFAIGVPILATTPAGISIGSPDVIASGVATFTGIAAGSTVCYYLLIGK